MLWAIAMSRSEERTRSRWRRFRFAVDKLPKSQLHAEPLSADRLASVLWLWRSVNALRMHLPGAVQDEMDWSGGGSTAWVCRQQNVRVSGSSIISIDGTQFSCCWTTQPARSLHLPSSRAQFQVISSTHHLTAAAAAGIVMVVSINDGSQLLLLMKQITRVKFSLRNYCVAWRFHSRR